MTRHASLILFAIAACTTEHAAEPTAPDAAAIIQPDAAPAAKVRKLAILIGQSNAAGMGTVPLLPDPSLAEPYQSVMYTSQVGTDTNPPAVLTYPLGPLGPRDGFDGVGHFGIELTMGRTLDVAEPDQWSIAKFAYGSTALAGEWSPSGVWPTGQPNLWTQQLTFLKQALTDSNTVVGAIVWIQGESDAPTAPLGQRYGLELAEFIGAERWALPCAPEVPFIFGRLNVANPQAGTPAVRAGQESNQAEHAIMIDQDAYPLGHDLTHYTPQAYLDLGVAYGKAILANEMH